MGHMDENGNWVEMFESQPYSTEEAAKEKIEAVIKFHVYEEGWILNGEPRIERDMSGNYIALVPLMKPAEKESERVL